MKKKHTSRWFLCSIVLSLVLLLTGAGCGAPAEGDGEIAELESKLAKCEAELAKGEAELAKCEANLAKAEEPPEVIEWRLQSALPASDPWYDPVILKFVDLVDIMSEGRLKITAFAAPEPVPPLEILDSVAAGVMDMGQTAPGYWAGKAPAFSLNGPLSTPGGLEDVVNLYYDEGAIELFRELYEDFGVYYVGPLFDKGTALWTTSQIRTLDDLQGLLVRSYGMIGQHLEALGASVVSLPSGEIYTGVATGTIEGATYGCVNLMMESWSLQEVAKYVMLPYLHAYTVGDVYVNMDSWNELPDDLKVIVETANEYVSMLLCRISNARDAQAFITCEEEYGVTFTVLPEADQTILRAAWLTTIEKHVADANDEYCDRYLQILHSFMRKMGYMD